MNSLINIIKTVLPNDYKEDIDVAKNITYEYDINDNVIQTKNQKGSITKYIYNPDKTVSRRIMSHLN